MSTEKSGLVKDSSIDGWQGLVKETRKRIERLEIAIEVFEENIRIRFPFDGQGLEDALTKKTETAKKAIPA